MPSSDGYADDWYGDCANTYAEETKQIRKLMLMGVKVSRQRYPFRDPVFDLAGRSVLDLGGGPVSPLLKAVNARGLAVLDPGEYPRWVGQRYRQAGVEVLRESAEHSGPWMARLWDEVWIMNTLRHVNNPAVCLATAQNLAMRCVRVCEWVDEPLGKAAGQVLRAPELDRWLRTEGRLHTWRREDGYEQTLYVAVAPA